jgi:SAM-dependent methyltransferase
VDYVFELESPEDTIRHYEWRGILTAVRSLTKLQVGTKWLDYGCGNGGLLRHCRAAVGPDLEMAGFEEGWIRKKAEEYGIRILSRPELVAIPSGSFDVITCIEVLEHVEAPLETLREIRRLLKPGGLFFFTTGNASPYRRDLLKWEYVYPDIHVSYFEPESLRRALQLSGFEPARRGYLPGSTDIIRFKCLKTIGVRKRAWWERLLPWGVLARLVDRRLGITAHPIGWAR